MDDSKTLEVLSRMAGKPHRISKLAGAHMAVRVSFDPLTGALHSHFNPIFVAGIERQGYSAAPLLREIERTLRDAGEWYD